VVIELDTGLTALDYPEEFEREGDVLRTSGAGDYEDFIRLRINLPIGSLIVKYIQ
jgi:hypothetical protein